MHPQIKYFKTTLLMMSVLCAFFLLGQAQTYKPPINSISVLNKIQFDSGIAVGNKFKIRFQDCDLQNTYNGFKVKYGCSKDPNQNTVILKFPNGTIFFDGKMGIDADGSPLSKSKPGSTDQPETSLQNVNADATPFIVLPGGGFIRELGLEMGDIAAVIFNDSITFAIVADQGPPYKIGEGSIALHEMLGHQICLFRNERGECTKLKNNSISKNVLYFVFPHSKLNIKGLSQEKLNAMIKERGQILFTALRMH